MSRAYDIMALANKASKIANELYNNEQRVQCHYWNSPDLDPIHTTHIIEWHSNADYTPVKEKLNEALDMLDKLDISLEKAYEEADALAIAAGEQSEFVEGKL